MILEYHRPQSIEEALSLLAREQPRTVPLGGGSVLSAPGGVPVAVVDLQNLSLDGVAVRGNEAEIGATVTLERLLSSGVLPQGLHKALRLEATSNLRRVATLAGTLVTADGRSPVAAVMLALDARATVQPGDQDMRLGDLLPLRAEQLDGRLITSFTFGINPALAYGQTARTPADWPLVSAAVARWPSGRTRVALGGHGPAPILAFDGPQSNGLDAAVRDAFSRAGDEWATAEYRQEVAEILVRRAIHEIAGGDR